MRIRPVTQSEFEDGTDYTNPKEVPLIYCGETNVFFIYGRVYNTYAPNIYWYVDKGSYDKPVGRLIYAIGESKDLFKIYFGTTDEVFINKSDFRNTKIEKLNGL